MPRRAWRRLVPGFLLAIAVVAVPVGCRRDEGGEEKRSPIQVVVLPTAARRATTRREAAASPAPTVAAKRPEPTLAPKVIATGPKPTALRQPTIAPTSARPTEPPVAVAPQPTAQRVRRAVVPRGTDLLAGPSAGADVLGTFEGRTEVEVLAEESGYSRVRAPVLDGGSVEGWVRSAAVGGKAATPATVARGEASPAPGPSAARKPLATPVPSKAKKEAGGKGPADIILAAIEGTARKKKPVPFPHHRHVDDFSVTCVDCHHEVKARGGGAPPSKTCTTAGCHVAAQCNGQLVPAKNRECPFFEDAFHLNCIECHRKDGGPTKCAECHSG